jgi:hypothetical protein
VAWRWVHVLLPEQRDHVDKQWVEAGAASLGVGDELGTHSRVPEAAKVFGYGDGCLAGLPVVELRGDFVGQPHVRWNRHPLFSPPELGC